MKRKGIQSWFKVKSLETIAVSHKTKENKLSHSNVMKGFKSAWGFGGKKRGK